MQLSAADFEFSVMLTRHQNPNHLRNDDNINCDSFPFVTECDNHFTFCLRFTGANSRNIAIDTNSCPLGIITTGVYDNNDDIVFSSILDVGPEESPVYNPLQFTGNSWPVSIIINVAITSCMHFSMKPCITVKVYVPIKYE